MRHGRKRLITALTSLAAVAAMGLVPASPSAAEPEIDDVRKRVDTLYREAEVASERHNDARIELRKVRKELKQLQARERRQQRALDAVQRGVEDSVVRQYEGEAVSGVSRVLVSEDPEAFVEQLSAMDAYNDIQQQMFADFAAQTEKVESRADKVEKRAERKAEIKKSLAADKAKIDEKASEAAALLDRLEAEERARLAAEREEQEVSRSKPRSAPEAQVSGNAAAAVAYARAQVGKAYVYGAAGPSSFDCSGLTMMAWRQAGVSLPHSSSAQYSQGRKVSRSELKPGDLVFYYQPISHVGIYAGNGQLVHAANPSTGVSVTSVDSMPFAGAVRPG